MGWLENSDVAEDALKLLVITEKFVEIVNCQEPVTKVKTGWSVKVNKTNYFLSVFTITGTNL